LPAAACLAACLIVTACRDKPGMVQPDIVVPAGGRRLAVVPFADPIDAWGRSAEGRGLANITAEVLRRRIPNGFVLAVEAVVPVLKHTQPDRLTPAFLIEHLNVDILVLGTIHELDIAVGEAENTVGRMRCTFDVYAMAQGAVRILQREVTVGVEQAAAPHLGRQSARNETLQELQYRCAQRIAHHFSGREDR
jgi:hypothetical protein